MSAFRVHLFTILLVASELVPAHCSFDARQVEVKRGKDTISDGVKTRVQTERNKTQPNVQSNNSTRTSWSRTLDEIKALVVPVASSEKSLSDSKDILAGWKLFLDEKSGFDAVPASERIGTLPANRHRDTDAIQRKSFKVRQRYDGFVSWEKLLQQWADDVTSYTAKNVEKSESNSRRNMEGTASVESGSSEHALSENKFKALLHHRREATGESGKVHSLERGSALSLGPSRLPFAPRPVQSGEAVVAKTDLSDTTKNVWIVTTAALPWMTGTAVNALLRAAYMCAKRDKVGGSVTILLPWLERKADQIRVYGKDKTFDSRNEQEGYVRNWLRNSAGMKEASSRLRIKWYTAWQERAENSIYSMGDITSLIPQDEADICILEEPEHLNWYRAPGEGWTEKFKHVVGIVHTNYFVYAQEQPAALIRAPAMRLLCSWMCRAHCHRVIKLSGTLQVLAPEKELVENVHGVRRTFLNVGEVLRGKLHDRSHVETTKVFGPEASPTVYFIGKMLWSKGIGSLIDLIKYTEESVGLKIGIDMYGYGPDADEAALKASKLSLGFTFHGPIDHAALAESHKIFINPSTSEVLCTTVAEALAMGKFVIVPSHPSNDFFAQFPNCLTYASKEEFVAMLYYALTHWPEPLTKEYLRALSWEAATERFEAAGSISVAEAEGLASVLSTPDAGIEISLPPLIEDEGKRKKVTRTLKKTRLRFRQFRARLSQEVQESRVLPRELQERVVSELDKKLDIDLDTVLASPKLRLKLSAAELDKQLLDLYNKVSQSPSGDVLRVVGGGTDVGKQNLYLKQQALRVRNNRKMSILEGSELYEEEGAVGLVRRSLKRNFPSSFESLDTSLAHRKGRTDATKGGMDMHMRPPFTVSSLYRPCVSKLK